MARLRNFAATTVAALSISAGVPVLDAAAPTAVSEMAPIADSMTTMFDVGGVRVIHRFVEANEVVAANVYLLGGTRQLTAQTAGIEQLLLEVTGYGTRRYSRDALRRQTAALGSTVEVSSGADWSRLGMRATRATFDSTWMMFADRIVAPTLDSNAIELVRSQLLTAVRQRRNDPDVLLSYLADSITYVGHPYALNPTGTEQSISSITRSALVRYHSEQVTTSRMLLVVVGQIERPRLERLVRTTLATLPRGQYNWTPPAEPTVHGDALVTDSRLLPTNYILGFFHGPPSTSADHTALRVAMAVLSGQLFSEIRSRRNLTYAVSAPFVERALSSAGIYVTTVSPDLTMSLIRNEVEALKQESVNPNGLSQLVQQFITEYFLDNETNAAQADFLMRAQVYQGDYRAADRFVDQLRAVTPEDIRRVARQYLSDARFAYVGDTTKISRAALSRF